MSNTNKGFSTLCIPLLTLLILISGCEEPGSVGSDYVDKSGLSFDTLLVNQFQQQNYPGYSGRLSYVSIGKYADPIFGDISTTAIIKPTLDANLAQGDSLDENYIMKLELQLDSTYTFGDTLSEATFSIHEVTSEWNGTAFQINSELIFDETNQLGSFTVSDERSIIVDLSDSWKEHFSEYYHDSSSNADSLYQYEFKGLAIVSGENANKILFPQISSSRFLAINTTDPDTTDFSIRDWAFTLNRDNVNYPSNVNSLHSTLEGIVKMDLSEFVQEIEGKNFIKAEVVLYEASDELENSLPESHFRPDITSINIDIGYESDPLYDFLIGAPEMLGSKRSSDNSFRINVTDYFNDYLYGNETEEDLYLGIGSSAGILRSTLIYNETAPESLQPKLILTFLEGEE